MLLSRKTARGLLVGHSVAPITQTSRLPVMPASVRRLFGYELESRHLRTVVERGRRATIGIWGTGGAGKTEFLAQALRPAENGWRGKLFISGRHLAAEDIIALVTDAIFAIRDPRSRPSTSVCSRTLAKCRLLVALDDVRSAEDLARARAALAASCICFTSEREFENAADEWIELSGLTIDQGIALLRDVARPNRIARETAASVVANLRGNPGRIRCAAAQGVPLRTIAANCTSPDAFDDFQLSLVRTKLSSSEIARLAAVAIFGDAALVGEKAAAVANSPFIERSCVGWAVPAGLRRKLNQLEFDDANAAEALLNALRRVNERLVQPRSLVECAAGLLARTERGGAPARAAVEILIRKLDRRGLWVTSATLHEALRASEASAGDSVLGTRAERQLSVPGASAAAVDSAHGALAQVLASRRKQDKVANGAITDIHLGALRGAEPNSSGGVAASLKAGGRLVGAGLAFVGVAALVHSLVWTAIVLRPQPNAVAAIAARTFLAAASPSHHLARNTPRRARVGAPHRLSSTPRVEPLAPPSILLLSMLPRKVFAGDTATICVSANHTRKLFVTGLGAFNPNLTTCHTILPKKTTSFIAYAANTRGQRTKRQITVVVEGTVVAGLLHVVGYAHGRHSLRGSASSQPGRFRRSNG